MRLKTFERKVFTDYKLSYVEYRKLFGFRVFAFGVAVNSGYCVGIWCLGVQVYYRDTDEVLFANLMGAKS